MNRAGPRRPRRITALVLSVTAALCAFVPATAAFAVEGQLDFIGSDNAIVEGGVTTGPDGRQVYATANTPGGPAVFAFPRSSATGELGDYSVIFGADAGGPDLDLPNDVTTSADGQNLYVTAGTGDSLGAFTRNPSTGALSLLEIEKDGLNGVDGLDGAIGVAISPDGQNLYVAAAVDDALTAFTRNPNTGALGFFEVKRDGVGGVDGLNNARGVSISPGGQNVYVASQTDDALAAFTRNPSTGALSFVEVEKDGVGGVDGLNGAHGVAVSPDGRHVYVASISDALVAFTRSPTTGTLNFVEAEMDGVGGVDGLDGARGVTVSDDGKHVYVASSEDGAVAVFSRDGVTGELDLVEVERAVEAVGPALDGAFALSASPDDRNLYVAADEIVAFTREPDTTAPETAIDSGAAGNTADATPTFGFSSNDPGFTAGFECRVDGGPFFACSSPETIGPLSDGPHNFEVRAVDTAGNADPSSALRGFNVTPDTVLDGSASAKDKQKQKGKKIIVEAKVKAGEDLSATATGKVKVGKKSYKLKKQTKNVSPGSSKNLKLKLKKSKDAKKIAKALKQGKKAKAKLTVKMTDDLGNKKSQKLSVKLKG